VAELQAKFSDDVQAELIKGDRGAFEVTLDGELIYSKLRERRFPRYAEVPGLITERM